MELRNWTIAVGVLGLMVCSRGAFPAEQPSKDLPAGHPRPSYEDVKDIDAMAAAVRKSRPRMYRGGWEWDRLLSRYVDGGRKETNALKILRAYFLSILDRYYDAEKAGQGDKFSLFCGHGAWGSGGRMRIYAELARQKMLTPKEQATFKKIVNQSLKLGLDYPNIERGVNNRPYGMNGGPAIAVRLFPDMPSAAKHRRWLKVLWRELTAYGDTTETNYYPYGPIFLQGLLDMAEGMGKFEDPESRKLIYALARRYLDYVHGGGVRGNPNSAAHVNSDRSPMYADPWNSAWNYREECGGDDGHVWYRLARHFKDPEFLWVSEQVNFGGRPPKACKTPPEYLKAYNRRYAWFVKRGIEPKVPSGASKIGYCSPLKYKVPERLYLCPGRESGKPFVSFYLYDRNNNYMHCCGDAMGRLYEYCADGAKLLHTSGKYSSGRASIGPPVAYDMLTVLPPDMAFPVTEKGRVGGTSDDTWKMASLSLPFCLNCRSAPDSKNWYYDEKIGKFRRTDDPGMGFAHGNMDGYWYLNDDFHLKSVHMGSFSKPTIIQNLRLGGPKGDLILAAFDAIPKNLKVTLRKGKESRKLSGDERKRALTVVDEGRRSGKGLRLNVAPGSSLALTLAGLDLTFDANDEYTRVSFDYKGKGAVLHLNGRTRPIYQSPLCNRGGVLEWESIKAENHPSTISTSSGQAGSGQGDDDSFGQFTYRNYFGAHSRWTRQTVLTAEGYLVVRDLYEPGIDVDGYQAAPCWLLRAEGDVQGGDRNWFDAPAWDHAWWQKQKKRVLLYLHPGKGLTFGQGRHSSSRDIGGSIHSSFAKAIVKAGKPRVWLSVLVPFNEGEDAAKMAKRIKTSVDDAGNCTAGIGNTKVTIKADGQWSVKR